MTSFEIDKQTCWLGKYSKLRNKEHGSIVEPFVVKFMEQVISAGHEITPRILASWFTGIYLVGYNEAREELHGQTS